MGELIFILLMCASAIWALIIWASVLQEVGYTDKDDVQNMFLSFKEVYERTELNKLGIVTVTIIYNTMIAICILPAILIYNLVYIIFHIGRKK